MHPDCLGNRPLGETSSRVTIFDGRVHFASVSSKDPSEYVQAALRSLGLPSSDYLTLFRTFRSLRTSVQ